MTDAVASAPQERGWGKVLLALAAFLLVPHIPYVAVMLPIEQTAVLIVPALAACALVGWWSGGRPMLALLWVSLTVLLLFRGAVGPQAAFADLARGWSLLAAGAFGVACIISAGRHFLPRGLTAVGLSLGASLFLVAAGLLSGGRVRDVIQSQLDARSDRAIMTMRTSIEQQPAEWRERVERISGVELETMARQNEQVLTALPRLAAPAFPALLALESLLALALAWTLYHRFSRARIGEPLGRLKEFRFNDQLVWGLIVAVAVLIIPRLSALEGAGINLFVFFGALFALRGAGVMLWFMPGGFGTAVIVAVTIFAPPLLTALSLSLGLGDTWADWRRLSRPTPRANR